MSESKDEFKERIKSVGLLSKQKQTQKIRDEIGNDTIEHWDGSKDVVINATNVQIKSQYN